jgi:AcrR family transcriptional regulator
MGLREDKKAEMRSAILETAVALFRLLGFDRTRVQDVVRQLRISEATFFNYFPSKQAVLDAAAEGLMTRSVVQLESEVGETARPVQERLEFLARQFARDLGADRPLAELLARHTRFLLATGEAHTRVHQLLASLMAEGQQRGEIRTDLPAVALAELYAALDLVTITGWINEEVEGGSLEERLLGAHNVFWSGAAAAVSQEAAVGL